MSFLKKIAQKIGIDKSIAYSSGARIVQAFTGIVSIFFITGYLTGVEQGFYYTFGSILAIQTFFELGLTGIITQYVSHEASHLEINEFGEYIGNEKYKSRLSSLLHFVVKWYSCVALLFFVTLVIVGFIFFEVNSNKDECISWKVPWILLSIGTAIKLFQSPLSSFFMGLDKVKEMSKISFYQQLILPISTWIGLVCDLKLYVVGISSLLSVLIWFIYIAKTNMHSLIFKIWNVKVFFKIGYMEEIFPFQWRIALSALSGYFIFSFLNPVLFAYQGPVIAGQMGMTLSVLSAVQSFSMSWLNTKVPLYSRLIAIKDYSKLDSIFNKTMHQMVLVCCVLMLAVLVIISALQFLKISINGELLSARFLSGFTLIALIFAYLVDQFTFSWATYLRCHKREPFLWISIFAGIGCCVSTYYTAKYSTVFVVSLSYCLVKLTGIPWGYAIFKKYKYLWHKI